MLKIVIPDPGLREYGGHHPAMINSIANTQAVKREDIHLEVYCNKACSDDFINSTQSKQVTIKKHFNTDFYKYFYQSPSLTTLNKYLNQLTKEYLSVFEQYTAGEEQKKTNKETNKEDNKTLFLYHTLNGEHATALAAAISIYNKQYPTPLNHCVFLMFNPIKHNKSGKFDNQHFINFKLGFSILAKQKCVQLYAGEDELQQRYQYLLNSPNKPQQKHEIAIHPCGLLSEHSNQVKKSKIVILFTGDAKVNKGFLALPALVEQVIQSITDSDVEFLIQYTITNDNEALKQTNKRLQSLAKLDSRIKLTTRFWSHTELHDNFAQANSIVFNYDSAIYQNQSSGVLWLAASYNLKMVFLSDNWLMREAEKLDCQYCFCSHRYLPQETHKYLMQNYQKLDSITSNNYRNILFQDIGKWLLNKSLPNKK